MTRIPNRTAHIKPSTREALMDQFASAADEIIRQREALSAARRLVGEKIGADFNRAMFYTPTPIRWWHRLMWWRK